LKKANRAVVAAAAAATAFLGLSGVAYRTVAHSLDRAAPGMAIAPGALNQLPLRIADWDGRDQPLDADIVRRADLQDYVNRLYANRSDGRVVGLYVAFGVRARDLMPHRPEVCYPGAGWNLQDHRDTALHIAADRPIAARTLTFSTGGFEQRGVAVVNYYVVDGQTCEDVSLLRRRAAAGQTSVRYVAQVQVTCRVEAEIGAAAAISTATEFAEQSGGLILDLLDRVTRAAEP